MRHAKAYFILLLCCLLPLTAYAENKKIVIPCAELATIGIEQLPPGYPFPDEACGDKCFHIVFTMEDATALRVNNELNAYKDSTRELYIGPRLLLAMEPFHADLPYSQKASSAIYATLKEAADEARSFCPNVTIKVPDVVRR